MHSAKFVFVAALLAVSVACGDKAAPTAPPLDVTFSATDLVVGTGTEAATGKTVRVYYTGWVYSANATDNKGAQFDANTSGVGFSFTIGAGQVIKGWEQGLPGMKVGGKRRLVIPPSLGYGSQGAGSIPPNAHLIFEIELLSVAG